MEKPTFTSTYDPQKISTIEDIPSSVLDEIFIRLPIPDLKSCRLVSNGWHNAIRDKKFVERVQSEHGIKADICVHQEFSPADVMALKIDGELSVATETYVAPLLDVESPRILGSVQDIVLFGDEGHSFLYMVNPNNQTCLEIVDESPEGLGELYGFAYNKAETDYCIVRVIQMVPEDGREMKSSAFMFSLQRNTWIRRKLRKLEIVLSQTVGSLDEEFYFCDSLCDNLVAFDLTMKHFKLIALPQGVRGHTLSFGVAREKLRSEQVDEVLLICSRNDVGVSNVWRMKKLNDGELVENLAVLVDYGRFTRLQPLCFLLGDANEIVLLEDERAIQVYSVLDQSKTEILNDGSMEGEEGGLSAIVYYHTSVSAFKVKVVTIKTAGTKRKKRDHSVGSANKKVAMEKLKQD